jgi:oligopeptide transport system permease protein
MLRFIASRILQSIAVLFCILTITFFLIRMAKGGPFLNEKSIPEHIVAKMNAYYGLDQPLIVQYFKYMRNFIQLDLGPSLANKGYTVNEIIAESFPISAAIGVGGLIIALLVGIPIGVVAAWRRNTMLDYAPMGVAMIGICLPTFVLGPLFATIFGLKLGWFAAAGWWNPATDWVLPALTLGLFYGGYIARITRGGMLDVLSQDFIRTAQAKGLPAWRILVFHSLKGGLLPVVSYLGPAVAGLIGGSFVMETIFQLPGLGKHFINAASNRDYTLIMGTVATFGVLILVMNFLSDVIQILLNPRLRGGSKTN